MANQKEKRSFLCEVKIEDSDGQIKELSKTQDFEIEWEGKIGKGKEGGEIVSFEKNGKNYNLIIKIQLITKGLFKDQLNICSVCPAPEEKFTVYYPQTEQKFKKGWFEVGKKWDKSWNIEPTQRRWQGPVIVGTIAFTLITGIICLVLWKKKRSSPKKKQVSAQAC